MSIYHERACDREYFPEYLQCATRTGNGFNKIMRTSNGFNTVTVIMYILPSKQEREILFGATRTCVWLKLDVCSMRVRFATQQRDTSGLINHQVNYFAKRPALSPFSYIEGMADYFIVYQFNTVSLFSNIDPKRVTKRIPSSSSSSSSVSFFCLFPRPASIALNDLFKRAFPFYS